MKEGTVSVATVELTELGVKTEIFEEGERDFVDDNIVAGFPLGNAVVEEFGCCGGDKI